MSQELISRELLSELKEKALEATSCGISIADCQQEDNPLIYVNSAFEEMTGYTKEEVIGKNCRFLQAEDRDQAQLEIIRHSVLSGKDCKVIIRNYRKDGTLFYNELILSPVKNKEGKLTHFIGIQNDVTEREISGQELRKTRSNKIAVKDYKEGSVRLLDPHEILYIKRDGRKVIIHTKDDELPTYFTIDKLESRLRDQEFYKASQSILVNINYIEHMIANGDGTYDIILRGQKESGITASRSGAKNILKDLQVQ